MANLARRTSLLSLLPSAAAMRAVDAEAARRGLDTFTLVETAGRAAARVLRRAFEDRLGGGVLVVCGKGGNGADGLALARALAEVGVDVHVRLAFPAERMSDVAGLHLDVLNTMRADLPGAMTVEAAGPPFPRCGLAVDALVGTGLTGALRPPLDRLSVALNRLDVPLVALDVPSGLDADTGQAAENTMRARLTVTFAAAKPGLVLGDGPAHAGRVVVANVGLPRGLIAAQIEAHGGVYRSTDAWARAVLPRRAADAHKYSAGFALVVGGSADYPGAPVLAAQAAARAGAGYVRLAAADGAVPAVRAHLVEIPVTALPSGPGGLDGRAAQNALEGVLAKASALVVGPGLGRGPGTRRTVRRLLDAFEGPSVVDADALAALDPAWLAAHARGPLVLTPHTGELERLLGEKPDLTDRPALVRRLAQAWGVVLVLKGLPSVVGTPDGVVLIGGPHSTALATAGTGDVLAGLTGGFLAQGLAPADAALLALHTGGRAAKHYARRHAAATMQAPDLLDRVPRVLHRLAADSR
jgi:ADP-dependent NAD(P)H-hydrate dehydratase / NAD(P)H-hydrate epimerase